MLSRTPRAWHPASHRPGPRSAARAWTVCLAAAALAGSGLTLAGAAVAQPVSPSHSPAAATGAHDYRRACAASMRPGRMSCMVLIRTGVTSRQAGLGPGAAPVGVGYGPASLQSAYKLASAAAAAGGGQTVAVVDAFDDPNAAADLAVYRSDWGLPACGAGCFRKVNQNGLASPLPAASGNTGWATEESLDLDMVSAICPKCHIILVEANSSDTTDLGAAVNAAVSLGAKYVSNSYGGSESPADATFDTDYYKHPGVAITASAGDAGYGVSYPAASQYVTSVGGTSLTKAAGSRGWTETVWGSSSGAEGTGSGCSADDAKPSWQKDTGCARRTDNDVAAVADPGTGVAIYDTYDQSGWLEVGGTSASSPIIASVFALAGTPAAGTYPASYLYQHASSLFDVTSGTDGSCGGSYLCTAKTGYDGPTGLGTPDGTAAFKAASSTGNTVTVTSPGNQSGTVGTAVSLQIKATDSASGQTLSYSATGLPAGLSISPTTGKITGKATTAGSRSVMVTAKDTTGAAGSASFTWAISTAGSGCTARQLLGNPGFESGAIAPWTTTPNVLTRSSATVPAHTGSWLAWLDGYVGPHTDTLAQTVTIPAACKHASFSFWLKISSNDPAGRAFDTIRLRVLGPGGGVLATLVTYSNQNRSAGYVQHTFSLNPYIGRKITLKFTGTETLTGHATSFFEDDNALKVS